MIFDSLLLMTRHLAVMWQEKVCSYICQHLAKYNMNAPTWLHNHVNFEYNAGC